MNRNRMIIGIVTAVVIGFAFSVYVYRAMQRTNPIVRPAALTHVVVAQQPLQVGQRLDPNNLRLIDWPSDSPVPGMFTRIEDCAGRALITPVTENEPILESKLAPKEAGAGLPATIPVGMRALSVGVNDVVAVAGFVLPGTMVDVLVTGQVSGGGNITRTILEDVRVLAAGQRVEQDREGKPQTVAVMTLLVSPEDAVKLTMAATEGRIQLALRNTIDTKTIDPPLILQASLFGGGAPAPVRVAGHKAPPPKPAPYVVEVITGTKKETKSFENQ